MEATTNNHQETPADSAGVGHDPSTQILVTGGTGFTGGHLCERLARAGYAVRALVRDVSRAQDLKAGGCDIVEGDVRDKESITRAMQGVDVVYDSVGKATIDGSIRCWACGHRCLIREGRSGDELQGYEEEVRHG